MKHTKIVTVRTGPNSTAQGELVADEWVTLWGYQMETGWKLAPYVIEGLDTHTLRVPTSWIKPINGEPQ